MRLLGAEMFRYLRLWFRLLKLSLMARFEYRINTLLHILVKLLWMGSTLIFFEIIYLHTDEMVGWSKFEMLLLLGTFTVVRSLYAAFFSDGVWELPDSVQTGSLDLLLAKPVSSQFVISTHQEDIGDLVRGLFGVFIVFYSIKNLGIAVGVTQVVIYLFLLLAAVACIYGLVFMVATLSIWLVRLENMVNFIWQIVLLGRVPVSVFPRAVAFFLTFIIPIAFASMVPAQVLLGRVSWPLVFYGLGISVVLLYLSHRFWNFALKHYTSAGG